MEPTPQFRTDLYQGTAEYYDRYRIPYPASLVDDLATRTGLSGRGRLLDVACGTGRVTFALSRHFADVVALDQEEEAVGYAMSVAPDRGVSHVQWRTGRAEDLSVDGPFELITIGDAFHRLDRRRVASLAMDWLQPGGHIALLSSSMPWGGSAPWQKVSLDLLLHWTEVAGSIDNIPPDLEEAMSLAPNLTVLTDAGLAVVGTYEFEEPYVWTVETLAGFAYSTSILSRPALGEHLEGFERDLHDRLLAVHPEGRFEETISFKYELALRP